MFQTLNGHLQGLLMMTL